MVDYSIKVAHKVYKLNIIYQKTDKILMVVVFTIMMLSLITYQIYNLSIKHVHL